MRSSARVTPVPEALTGFGAIGLEAPGGIVDEWLDAPPAWVPEPGPGFRRILGGLVRNKHPMGNLVSDAVLAALAIEFGTAIVSADSDFARFHDVEWINPFGRTDPSIAVRAKIFSIVLDYERSFV